MIARWRRLQAAALTWGASAEQVGALASMHGGRGPIIIVDEGGGLPYPWERPFPIHAIEGFLNTQTGNVVSSEPLLSFKSYGGTGVDLTLYHNSQTMWDQSMGLGWSCNYDARLTGSFGDDVNVRWGDGTNIPYAFDSTHNTYVGPIGIFDKLAHQVDGSWKITKPDQTTYWFSSSGTLATITSRGGYNVTIVPGTYGIDHILAPDGRTVQFNYDATSHMLHSITDPLGRCWVLSYDTYGNMIQIQYPELSTGYFSHKFTYSDNCIVSKTDFNGKVWNFDYEEPVIGSAMYLHSIENPLEQYTTFTYGSTSTTVSPPGGQATTYNYSGGEIAGTEDAMGYSDAWTYGAGNLIQNYTDKRGQVSSFTWDANGNLLTATDPLGHTTSLSYDSANDVLTSEDALSNTTSFNYDSVGNLLTVTDPLGHIVDTNTYDARDELLTSKDALGNEYQFIYNTNGDLFQTCDPLGNYTTFSTNSDGELTAVEDAMGNTEAFFLDAFGRLTYDMHPDGTGVAVTADPEGNVTKVTDENGHSATAIYDDAGRLTSITDANGSVQSFTYNINDWLKTATNGLGYTRSYNYTPRGQLSQVYVPSLANPYNYGYDQDGNLNQSEDPSGVTTTFAYDAAGREASYTASAIVSFGYDAANRPTSMVDSQGTSTISYNADSQVTQLATPQGTVNYGYDLDGRTHTVERYGSPYVPDTYNYDAAGRVTSVLSRFGQTTSFLYDNDGRATKETLPNGTYSTFGYDTRSRITALTKYQAGGSSFATETYNYDNASNLLSKTIGATTTSYTYDPVGQLLSESYPSYAASYTYDANGNRLTKTLNGATDTYSYDSGDKVQSVVNSSGTKSYTYDSAGRTSTITTSAGTTTFSYDSWGHVMGLTYPSGSSNTFAYTGTGARATRSDLSGTRVFLRDGLNPGDPVIFDDALNYIPHLYERTAAGADRFYNSDAQGSLDDVTDDSGNLLLHHTFDAFGNAPLVNRWFHSWHEDGNYEDDWSSGLKLLGNRYYDPTIGRFLTPDPACVGSNWYAYCGNNPNSFEDPLGLQDDDVTKEDGKFDPKEEGGGGSVPEPSTVDPDGWPSSYGIAKNCGPDGGICMDVGLFMRFAGRTYESLVDDFEEGHDPTTPPGGPTTPFILIPDARDPNGIDLAFQDESPEAMALRDYVNGGGALYRWGTPNRSNAAEGQFWAPTSPFTPGFASAYGIPPENISEAGFVESGVLRPGAPFITRPAPAVGMNGGGAMEVVVSPGSVDLHWFTMGH